MSICTEGEYCWLLRLPVRRYGVGVYDNNIQAWRLSPFSCTQLGLGKLCSDSSPLCCAALPETLAHYAPHLSLLYPSKWLGFSVISNSIVSFVKINCSMIAASIIVF